MARRKGSSSIGSGQTAGFACTRWFAPCYSSELVRRSRHEPCHERAARWLESPARPRARSINGCSRSIHERRFGCSPQDLPSCTTAAAKPRSFVRSSRFLADVVDDRCRLVDRLRGQPHPRVSIEVRRDGPTGDMACRPVRSGGASARSQRCERSLSRCRAIGPWQVHWLARPSPSSATSGGQYSAGRFAWNTSARSVALSESWDDDNPQVRDATMAMSRDVERGLSLMGVQALGEAMAGRPIDALRVAAGVRHAAATMSILRSELGIAEALRPSRDG